MRKKQELPVKPGAVPRARHSLKESQLDVYFSTFELLSSFVNPILVLNTDASIQFVNHSFEELTGYRLAEIKDKKPPYPWWAKETAAVNTKRLKKDMQSGIKQFEHLFQDKYGKPFWVVLTLTPTMHNGTVTGYVSNWVDITTQKLKQLRKTQEIKQTEKKLRENLDMEVSWRSQLFRMLVHELKTPLSSTLIASELLCEELKREPFLSLAKNVKRSVVNLSSRIDELMDVARGETGKIELRFSKVDIAKMLRQIEEDITIASSGDGKSFTLDMPAAIPVIWCDESRVRQILLNLLNNAIKFTDSGDSIALRVRLEKQNILFEIQDSGRGIPKHAQSHLFKPYHRVKGNEDHHSGFGVGLFLCKILVDLHEGQIGVESKPGAGSKFSFSLPLGTGNKT